MKKYTDHVTDVTGEILIRDYLKRRLGLSTSLIGKVKYGNVLLNGAEVHMRATVKNGDRIDITLPEEESENIEPMDIPLDILYEDEYVLVVNKPINMPVHPSRGNHLPTLANAVRHYIGHPFVFRAINRLDRDTSGIVLIAKDRLAGAKLYAAMKEKKFCKVYLAEIIGIPEENHGFVNAPIARESEGNIRRVVRDDGKECLTEYEVISVNKYGNATVRVIPHTGRTHQIRVHMAHIGHPLIDDFLYGERVDGQTYSLHCVSLTFPHPKDGKMMKITTKMADAKS